MNVETRINRQRPAWVASLSRAMVLVFDTRWLPVLFLLCALPTGLRLALLTPMSQVADEPAHIARAAALLHGQIMGQRLPAKPAPMAGVEVNNGLIAASLAEFRQQSGTTQAQIRAARKIQWSPTRSFDFSPGSVEYLPVFYVPGTIGIAIGRALGESPLNALYTGRIAMLCAFLLLAAMAIRSAAFGRPLLFALLSLPMTLSLAASFNQDGGLIAASALVGALLTRERGRNGMPHMMALVLFSVVLCSKPPYGLLLFAALIPIVRPGFARRFVRVCLFALPPMIWVVLMIHYALVPIGRPPYHPGLLWPGDRSIMMTATSLTDNLRGLLAHPWDFIRLPINYLAVGYSTLFREAVGVLGWLNVFLSPWMYDFWFVSLGVAAIGVLISANPTAVSWRFPDSGFIVIIVAITILLMELSVYLSWDNVGVSEMYGVQGRYFLLMVPFLMLALPRLGLAIKPSESTIEVLGVLEMLTAVPALIVAFIDIAYLPTLIQHALLR